MLLITPLDIQNKEFKRSLRGYDVQEVDIFLDEIIDDYEKIFKENIELKDKVGLLSDQIRQYNTMEETLKNTLIAAQTTADEMTSSARLKAANIIENAEISGDKLIDLANEDVRKINKEFEYLKKELFAFKTKYQAFIQAQLISLDQFYEEIERDTSKEEKREYSRSIEEDSEDTNEADKDLEA